MSDIKPWKELRREAIQDCRIFTVNKTLVESPYDASQHDFFVIDSADWVNIVPITRDNQVVMIRQYRHGSAEVTLEIPGGIMDPGEDPCDSAIRECLEETGYRAEQATSLGVLRPNPAIFPNRVHTYVAYDVLEVAEIQNTQREQTSVELIAFDQLPELLNSSAIDHALVVATLWRLLYHSR